MEQSENELHQQTVKVIHKKPPINWRAVFAESAFVGASIIFAFALQDWDEEKDIEERTLIALCNVKSELAFNRVLLKSEYMPRQRGLLALTNASMTQLNGQPDASLPKTDFKSMLVQESLRYSAWTLAGESGYLLHANFQLATEIGALFDFQRDTYATTMIRVSESVANYEAASGSTDLSHYSSIATSVSEWSAQTHYLQEKYETLFSREDFIELNCEA
ncbi:hypothetical protein DRW07_05715 [Alteromonas sediminis]|uniref:Uncharacterized protein n=1 Tax=Alteromonas sediminis TaxID=2259342 RepID=A0A3N5YNB7_9ALTE|nr:hypothetical protein [Alteromonas sediminis]RPJ67041.1 hypothetical protein DRW07_05715 [Alteromonas sediminis]